MLNNGGNLQIFNLSFRLVILSPEYILMNIDLKLCITQSVLFFRESLDTTHSVLPFLSTGETLCSSKAKSIKLRALLFVTAQAALHPHRSRFLHHRPRSACSAVSFTTIDTSDSVPPLRPLLQASWPGAIRDAFSSFTIISPSHSVLYSFPATGFLILHHRPRSMPGGFSLFLVGRCRRRSVFPYSA